MRSWFDSRSLLRTLMLVVTCVLMFALANVSNAQTATMRQFINEGPWIPLLTGEPENTVSSASLGLIYGASQPTAGDTFTISAPNAQTETYEFYANNATYTGSNHGIKIGVSVDSTYSTASVRVNLLSNIVQAQTATGSNAWTLYASGPYVAQMGNSIRVNMVNVHNITPTSGTLSGGHGVRRGQKGSIVAGIDDTASSYTLWIKTTNSDLTSGVWKRFILDAVEE